MSDKRHLPLYLCFVLFTAVLLIRGNEAASFKAGKGNVTTFSPGLFACKKISFSQPFNGGKKVKVFASFGHSVKRSPTRGNGAAIWVESEDQNQFTTCVSEYGEGSNGTAEVNWIAVQSVPSGAQIGTAYLDSWTTGTQCKRIDFPQRFMTPPTVLVTPSHTLAKRPQDPLALWIQHPSVDSFNLCVRETKLFDGLHQNIKINWLAFTNLNLDNFTLTNSLLFANITSPSHRDNYVFCQKINFTDPFFFPPVVVVTPKRSYNNSRLSAGSGCDAIVSWVEHTSTMETQICVKRYYNDAYNKEAIQVGYVVIGDLDPCLDVTCDYHCLCKAFGPSDARCVSVENCPSFQEPICSSNGTTYDNKCLFEQEMCFLQLNFTVQHPGSCEGFPFQRGRRHMPQIPSLGYSHCEVIRFQPCAFYPDKPIKVQITVNNIDTIDKSFVHDAAVSWVEHVNYHQFTTCVMAAGFNERKSSANVTVDWMGYQGAPDGGVSGEVRISQWWTGTTCETVNFPSGKFSVFVTAAHHHAGLKRDAASVWLEDLSQSSVKICLRELQNYAGSHEDIYVNWLAFSSLHKPLFSEHSSVYFANSQPPPANFNNAFCKYINTTGARVCLKELYGSKYDPLSISYTVLSDICRPGWSYFGGYCYFTSRTCASWLTAESNCSTMSSSLVTVHNQEENVYIQHRILGERSWIGLNDRSVEGSFVWTNKEVSSFRFWAPRQPNNWRNGDCVHTLGAKHGYTWNDVPCDNCNNFTCFTDFDECTANTFTCDVNAACQNTVSSFTCLCTTGYTGDGQTCHDVNECTTGNHNCHGNAECTNTEGSHSCICKAGFTGDGRNCTDVDECNGNLSPCHTNATCKNTIGSHKCSCKPGFTGDAYSCQDIDECLESSSCPLDATCTNTEGSYECICPVGYRHSGNTCEDIDECTQGSHDCLPSLANCTNTVGSYNCSCNPGLVGDGKKSCMPEECQKYARLDRADRKVTYLSYTSQSDHGLGPGWFRFEGAAGTRMASTCPPRRRCSARLPGWLEGGHPSVADGQSERRVCFRGVSNCCLLYTTIKVRNCSSFYVYYLHGTPANRARLRYCGSD